MPVPSKHTVTAFHIAPCGMNCALCMAYQRVANRCHGCNGDDQQKPQYCVRCRIKQCPELRRQHATFCGECEAFPCTRIKNLDKRYRTKYGMNMIDNLRTIEKLGIEKFIRQEQRRWKCSHCGNLVSVHRPACLSCGAPKAVKVKRRSL
jgi:hypothetical protein